MTLLELLDEAAKDVMSVYGRSDHFNRERARALRKARERLLKEMKCDHYVIHAKPILEVLSRINGCPDPAPRDSQPESPKSHDPVIDEVCEYIRAGYPMNSNHEWREDLIRRLRAASRRNTP